MMFMRSAGMSKVCGECENFDRDNEDMDGNAYCNSRNVMTYCDWEACNRFKKFNEEIEDNQ